MNWNKLQDPYVSVLPREVKIKIIIASFVDQGDKTIPGPGTYAPWRWDKI